MEAMLHEYDAVRQESMQAIGNRSQIIAFGLAAIGAIFAATLAVGDEARRRLAPLTLRYAIPLLSVLVVAFLAGETQRMERAGEYLIDLERRISRAVGQPGILNYEHWLETKKRPVDSPTVVVMLAWWLLFIVGAPILSVILSQPAHPQPGHSPRWRQAVIPIVVFTGIILLMWWGYQDRAR